MSTGICRCAGPPLTGNCLACGASRSPEEYATNCRSWVASPLTADEIRKIVREELKRAAELASQGQR